MSLIPVRLALLSFLALGVAGASAQEAPAPEGPRQDRPGPQPRAAEDIRERILSRVEALLREHRERVLEDVRRVVAEETGKAEDARRRREAQLRAGLDQARNRARDIARRMGELSAAIERVLAQVDEALGEKGKEESGPAKPADAPRPEGAPPREARSPRPPRPEEAPIRRFLQAREFYDSGAYEKAIEGFAEAAKALAALRTPEARFYRSRALYGAACSHAMLGQSDRALQVLEESVRGGFRDLDLLENDAELDGLREDPRFEKLVRLARSIRG